MKPCEYPKRNEDIVPLSGEMNVAPTKYARLPQHEQEFLDRLRKEPPLGSLSVAEERERMRQGQSSSFSDYLVDVTEFLAEACSVYVIRPREACEDLPITFYLHGGGWVLGSLETHTKLVSELALRSCRAVAFVDYPRAPETRFPSVVNICVAAVQETLRSAAALKLSAENFLLAGDSSGGNLALALTLASQRGDLATAAGLVLLYPVTDCATDSPSYVEFADNSNLSRRAMDWFWEQYLPDVSLRANTLASPLRAVEECLKSFPPTLVVTCEYDVLRDQGEALVAKLVEAGVEATAVRWLGALHGFLVTEELSRTPSAQLCVDLVAKYCQGLTEVRSVATSSQK